MYLISNFCGHEWMHFQLSFVVCCLFFYFIKIYNDIKMINEYLVPFCVLILILFRYIYIFLTFKFLETIILQDLSPLKDEHYIIEHFFLLSYPLSSYQPPSISEIYKPDSCYVWTCWHYNSLNLYMCMTETFEQSSWKSLYNLHRRIQSSGTLILYLHTPDMGL